MTSQDTRSGTTALGIIDGGEAADALTAAAAAWALYRKDANHLAGLQSDIVLVPSATVGAVLLANTDDGEYLLASFMRATGSMNIGTTRLLYDQELNIMRESTHS